MFTKMPAEMPTSARSCRSRDRLVLAFFTLFSTSVLARRPGGHVHYYFISFTTIVQFQFINPFTTQFLQKDYKIIIIYMNGLKHMCFSSKNILQSHNSQDVAVQQWISVVTFIMTKFIVYYLFLHAGNVFKKIIRLFK